MAVTNRFKDTEATNLFNLLNGKDQFLVPDFQRNYAWTEEIAEALWHDLVEGFYEIKDRKNDAQDAQYLLGPIVLVHDVENKYWVIDGQQRLSTLTMLFCIARDIMRENIQSSGQSKPEGYDKIMEMLENTDGWDRPVGWKLTLNDTDKDLFLQIQEYEDVAISQIERIKKIKPKPKSQKLLINNYVLLYDHMMNAICAGFNRKNKNNDHKKILDADKKELISKNLQMLNYFLAHIKNNNFVVKIVVEDNGTAYQIFETLNYRGRSLSKSNLIKNHVLNLIKNKQEQRDISNRWNTIFDETINPGSDDEFILESLRSRNYNLNQKPSRKNLFDVVVHVLKNEINPQQYVKALKEDAEFLGRLYNPYGYVDEETKYDFYTIRTLKARHIRAPILTAYRKWYNEQRSDFVCFVHFLVKFFFNEKIIRGKHAGKLEDKMLDIIKHINQDAPLTHIINELQKDYDHDDFEHRFSKFMLDATPNNVAKYVLRQITIHLGTKYNDVHPIDALTLEHILPKHNKKWNNTEFFKNYSSGAYKDDVRMDDFVPHLGNLTLLNGTVNEKLQNDTFLVKKDTDDNTGYSKSNLEINKQTVCIYDKWTANTIEDRAQLLAKYASEIWNLRRA